MDSDKRMVDISWENKGCVMCRRLWETGVQPERLGMNVQRQAYLHYCNVCGSYWEQNERRADVISKEDAAQFYREYIRD